MCFTTRQIIVCGLILASSLLFHFREENLAKINKRVSDYKVDIRNPPRSGKKLLVLDVDYTIFG